MPVLESSQLDSDKTSASAASNSLIDDSWNFARKHPGETALRAGLALGVIALSKGRAVGVAEKEIAPLARAASERGTLNFATGAVEATSRSADSLSPLTEAGYRHIPWNGPAPESLSSLTQAAYRHIPWNGLPSPATRALEKSALPITTLNRALAANQSILSASPWTRSSAIEGGAEYMQAQAQRLLPEGVHGLVKDAWYGNQAQALSPAVVDTFAALAQGVGKDACRDFVRVDKVANMVGAHGKPEDYVAAYRQLEHAEAYFKR